LWSAKARGAVSREDEGEKMSGFHFWYRPPVLPAKQFKAAAADCRKATASTPDQLWADDHLVEYIERDCYHLRIPRKLGAREQRRGRRGLHEGFCDTRRGRQATDVCACLIVFHRHFGERFLVKSQWKDEHEGWASARKACQEALGYGADFTLRASNARPLTRQGLTYTRRGDGFELENG
jgi:hypothetical protein